MLKTRFFGIIKVAFRCKEVVSLWVTVALCGFETGFLFGVMKRLIFASFTCTLALGGAMVGTIAGAMKGQTTETGFVRGAGIGAVSGAITAVQLLEVVADGESLSKVALLSSLVNGRVFMEWVSPAVLKAYQWQMSSLETSYREISDIYDVTGYKGLPKKFVQKLPQHTFFSTQLTQLSNEICCSICLQDFKEGDLTRKLPSCGHLFHLECVDTWLTRNGSCPICRTCICTSSEIS